MKWHAALIVLAVIALGAGLYTLDHFPVGVFHDDAMYVVLARALATGQGYRWINLPDAPAASHFPPGFPLVLAALWRIAPDFPGNLTVFKTFNVICFGASVVLIAQLARERFESERWGVVLGVLAILSVPLLVLVTMVLSEPLFLAIALLVLLLGERLLRETPAPRRAFALGLLIGLAVLVRSHGMMLVVALLAMLLIRGRRREAGAAALGMAVLIIPWQLWIARTSTPIAAPLAGNYGSYSAWWLQGLGSMGVSMITATVQRTTMDSWTMLLALFSPGRSSFAHVITSIAMVAGGVAGAIVLARRAPLSAVFLAAYTAIVIIWPFAPARFFWGMWPLVLLLFAAGVWPVFRREEWPRPARIAVGIASAWLVVGYAMYEVRAIRGQWWSSISRGSSPRIDGAVQWIEKHTAPADVIAADDEGAVFLYTGRKSVPVAAFTAAHYLTDRSAVTEATEGLIPLVRRYPVSVVIVGSRKTFEMATFLASKGEPLLAPLEEFPGGVAFTVLRK